MRRYKNAYIIIGFQNGTSYRKVYQEGYEKKEDAEACLKDMGCTYDKEHSPFWRKDNMLYSIMEIHINKKF